MRLDRIQAIDVHQGPLQRAFGVFAVDVQTGAGAKGGEISLPALTPEAVAELRAPRPGAAVEREQAPTSPSRRISAARARDRRAHRRPARDRLPVLAAALPGARSSSSTPSRARRRCAGCRTRSPRSCSAPPRCSCWPGCSRPSGALVAFGGFTLVRDGERLRIRRGLVQRSEATVPVSRVRAVRVVEGVFRRPFGLATLTVEVTGYADEAAAARTLFPLVRVRDVEALLDEFLPELADDPRGLRSPARPRRAPLLPVAAARSVRPSARRRGSWSARTRSRCWCSRRCTAASTGAPRAGGCATAAWRSARCCSPARPCSPRPASASRTRSRRTSSSAARSWPISSVAFGKQTTARVRHLDALRRPLGLGSAG